MRSTAPRFGPLSLLSAALLPVVGAYGIHEAAQGVMSVAVSVAGLVVLSPWMVRDWRPTLLRFGFGLFAALSLGLSTWLYGGRDLDNALAAVMRVLYLVIPAAALTSFIDPSALGDHLGQRLRLPARAVVASTAALERLESLGEQWQQIGRARRARGVGADGNVSNRARVTVSMALALLISTMRMSSSLALAMDARGFATAQRRTWAEPAPWLWRDTLIAIAGVCLAVLPWLLRLPVAETLLLVG